MAEIYGIQTQAIGEIMTKEMFEESSARARKRSAGFFGQASERAVNSTSDQALKYAGAGVEISLSVQAMALMKLMGENPDGATEVFSGGGGDAIMDYLKEGKLLNAPAQTLALMDTASADVLGYYLARYNQFPAAVVAALKASANPAVQAFVIQNGL